MPKIIKDFEKIFTQATSEQFLNMQALGGEIPFFIYAFDSAQQDLVTSETNRLIKRIEQNGEKVLNINLYNLMVDMLNERDMLSKVLAKEQSLTKEKLHKTLQNVLDVETKIIPKIEKMLEEQKYSMVFITGVGEVFPTIRSHSILNNLQSVILECPTLMFFPGEFDGHSLKLFGKLKDDNYYRAFNISNYKFQG
jgi:hypothetical protein